jgi:hypothetical protein
VATEVTFIYSSGTGMENLDTLYDSLLASGTTSQAGFVSLDDATAINESDENRYGHLRERQHRSDPGLFLLKTVLSPPPGACCSAAAAC